MLIYREKRGRKLFLKQVSTQFLMQILDLHQNSVFLDAKLKILLLTTHRYLLHLRLPQNQGETSQCGDGQHTLRYAKV